MANARVNPSTEELHRAVADMRAELPEITYPVDRTLLLESLRETEDVIRHRAADTHRAAAAALEALAAARDEVELAEVRLDAAIRAAKSTPGVTVEQIGEALGVTRRAVYKRLDRTS